jgi:hypothetical protein
VRPCLKRKEKKTKKQKNRREIKGRWKDEQSEDYGIRQSKEVSVFKKP